MLVGLRLPPPPRGAQAISNPSKVAIGGAGAGCSTPLGGFRCLRESGGTSGGGTARCGGGGGGSMRRARGRPKKGAGGTGTGKKVRWTKEETVALWECVVGCDVAKGDGAIKRVIELYNNRNLTPRNESSITSKVTSLRKWVVDDGEGRD